MTLTAGAWVRTPDGDVRRVVKYPYWMTALVKTMAPLVLLDDDTAWAAEALESVTQEAAA